MKIIPAIDLKDGKCVRLLQGDFRKTTEYSSDPAAIGRRFSTLAVEKLHLVDLDGARSGTQRNQALVEQIVAESGLAVQLGGGIRQRDDLKRWFAAGVIRCVLGSVAINDPETVLKWLQDFGADTIVLALDVRVDDNNTPMLMTHGWSDDPEITLWNCLDTYYDAGARQVLCTDVARDGAMSGPNFQLYADILMRYPELRLQASGGVRDIDDLWQLRKLGVPYAITGRALLDGEISAVEVASFQQNE